jgi:dolichol-phosphate mannosyltransferase
LAAPRVLVVVPTYNERDNVVPLVRELLAQGEAIDVWVADDGSPDGTADAVRSVIAEHPGRVQLVLRKEKAGRGAAVMAAFKLGLADPKGYQVFFEMDADFSHHPRELPKFLAKLAPGDEGGCDMVVGSRYVPGGGSSEWGYWRPLLSAFANRYIALVAGVPIRDTTSGFRAYKRAVLEETEFDRIKIRGYVVHGEMAYQAYVHGFRLGEVPIHFKNRAREASKLSGEEIYTALVNFALLRFRYGLRPRRRPERAA